MGCLQNLRSALCKHLRYIHMLRELQAKSSHRFYLQDKQHYVVNNSAPYSKASKIQTVLDDQPVPRYHTSSKRPRAPPVPCDEFVPSPPHVSDSPGHRQGEYSQPWTHTAELFPSKHTSRRKKTRSHFVHQPELQRSDPEQRADS